MGKGQRSRAASELLGLPLGIVVAAFLSLSAGAHAQVRTDTEACRQAVAALLTHRVEAALMATHPDPERRVRLHELFSQIVEILKVEFKNKPVRLERTLPDISVDGRPASVQLWRIGQVERLFIGCMFVVRGDDVGFVLRSARSRRELLQGLRIDVKNTLAGGS